jgi:hypothetical protein
MASSEKPLRLRDTDWRTIEGETIVLDRSTERYLSLNRSATVMWELLVTGTTRPALIAALVATFEIGDVRATKDVDAFLADLRLHGLIADDAPE